MLDTKEKIVKPGAVQWWAFLSDSFLEMNLPKVFLDFPWDILSMGYFLQIKQTFIEGSDEIVVSLNQASENGMM